MGLTLSLNTDGRVQIIPLDSQELTALQITTQQDAQMRNAFNSIFRAEQDGTPRRLTAQTLKQAVSELSLRAAQGLRTATYWIVCSPFPGVPPGSASSVGGIRIDGQLYRLIGGVDRCNLEKVALSEDGKRVEVKERRDVRNLKSLATENMGEIRIQKRSKPGRILAVLRKLDELLSNLPAEAEVVVTVG